MFTADDIELLLVDLSNGSGEWGGFENINDRDRVVDDLDRAHPEIDFGRKWFLIGYTDWQTYEESGAYWLFDREGQGLYMLQDVHSVMVDYEPPVFDRDIAATTIEEWLELVKECAQVTL